MSNDCMLSLQTTAAADRNVSGSGKGDPSANLEETPSESVSLLQRFVFLFQPELDTFLKFFCSVT